MIYNIHISYIQYIYNIFTYIYYCIYIVYIYYSIFKYIYIFIKYIYNIRPGYRLRNPQPLPFSKTLATLGKDFGAVPFGAKVRQRLAGNGLEAPWGFCSFGVTGKGLKKHGNFFS